ncbi:MAG: serine hydrolase family protein [Verrucomicrobiaceae bacterium]|nr:serine hydrolase family protein [Verrucomicrobiaceae bacterium]
MRDLTELDILIVPGRDNSGAEHWQTYWQKAFPKFRRVEQDDWVAPTYADWSRNLDAAVHACKKPVVLVAHSLGTILITRWAQTAATHNVLGAFLVATSDVDEIIKTEGDSRLHGFAPVVLQSLPFASMVVASRNDERVTFERAKLFAQAWGSHFVDGGELGHIGSRAKLGYWPQGLVWFGQFIATITASAKI